MDSISQFEIIDRPCLSSRYIEKTILLENPNGSVGIVALGFLSRHVSSEALVRLGYHTRPEVDPLQQLTGIKLPPSEDVNATATRYLPSC